jgi:hypothetical protein
MGRPGVERGTTQKWRGNDRQRSRRPTTAVADDSPEATRKQRVRRPAATDVLFSRSVVSVLSGRGMAGRVLVLGVLCEPRTRATRLLATGLVAAVIGALGVNRLDLGVRDTRATDTQCECCGAPDEGSYKPPGCQSAGHLDSPSNRASGLSYVLGYACGTYGACQTLDRIVDITSHLRA